MGIPKVSNGGEHEPTLDFEGLRRLPVDQIRMKIRSGEYLGHTAGLGLGYLQANLVILPEEYALDFFRFCQRNPKPCPLVGVSDTGNPYMSTLGGDIDIRTDVPAYYVYEDGKRVETVNELGSQWRDDFVAFALGCSFTFEDALQREHFPLWHIDNNTTVPMFRSNIKTVTAGPFRGPTVVSMRAIDEEHIDDVVEISRKFPLAHGAPVHWGDPSEIGIQDVGVPDWGDPSPIGEGEIPVFWACGVTPQVAIERAKVSICITHKPGHMLITDVEDNAEIPIVSE